MGTTPYDPMKQVSLTVLSMSPHTVAFRLWFAAPGDSSWTLLADGTLDKPSVLTGPYAVNTQVCYALAMGGNPQTPWKTQLRIEQGGIELACSPSPETGLCDQNGVGSVIKPVTLK